MKKVIVNGAGVKLNNKWCFKGQKEIISEEEYLANKEFVGIIEDIKETNERVIEIIVKNETIDIEELKHDLEEYVENYKKEPIQKTEEEEHQNPDDNNDEELEALKATAKKLGINVTHNMRKDTIIKKIAEAKKTKEEKDQNLNGE